MLKAGRFTAAIVLTVVGVLLIMDEMKGTHLLAYFLKWWPAALILLGLEVVLAALRHFRHPDYRIRLDIGSLLFAAVLSIIVLAYTQPDPIIGKWANRLPLPLELLSGGSGPHFDKDLQVPLGNSLRQIELTDDYGNVSIRQGDVEKLQIHMIITVPLQSKTKAKAIADASTVRYSGGDDLKLAAAGGNYRFFGLQMKPRMDLQLTVPAGIDPDWHIKLVNGKAVLQNLRTSHQISITDTNGSVEFTGISGNVQAQTVNGSAAAEQVSGDVDMKTVNGSLSANSIGGDVVLTGTNGSLHGKDILGSARFSTTNGSISVSGSAGDITARSTTGSLTIDGVPGNLSAQTTAGSIHAETSSVGGDWYIHATIGSVELDLPQNGSYTVDGHSGRAGGSSGITAIKASLEGVQGRIGGGLHKLRIETNGKIQIRSKAGH